MGDVIEFGKKEPHISGAAKCMGCGYEWIAVAPLGTSEFECTECGCWKGVMKAFVLKDEPFWQCNCGCDLFRTTKNGNYCANCGNWQANL